MRPSIAKLRNQIRIGIAAAVLGGLGVALQSKVNGALGSKLSDGFAAALISFGSGLIIVTIFVAAQPVVRSALRDGDVRLYQCLGGTCGALLVASQGLTVSVRGVAIFTVAAVGGQTMANTLVGVVLTLLAVVVAGSRTRRLRPANA